MSNETSGPLRFTAYEQRAITVALRAMERCLRKPGVMLTSPSMVREFLQLRLAALDHEVFSILYLDSQSRLIAYEELFRGTLNQTAVYPREVAKRALAHNAAAVILAHNHPSTLDEPSRADRVLTLTLKNALELLGISVLDHLIIAGTSHCSFAERGLL